MSLVPWHARPGAKPVLFFGLVSLLFLQLVSDFVESIYTFGLLGTDIPPEIIAVVLFFTPALLLPFRRALPLRSVLILAGFAAIMRALAVSLPPAPKLIAAGLGTGALLMLFPIVYSHIGPREKHPTALALGAGLALGLSASILLRTLGSGSDLALIYPPLAWLLAAITLYEAVDLGRAPEPEPQLPPAQPAPFGATLVLCIGLLSALLMLYFAFASPTVLSRWAAADYRLVLLALAVALGLHFALQSTRRLEILTPSMLLGANLLFLLLGVMTLRTNGLDFPSNPAVYPIDPHINAVRDQLPLFGFILLCPVVLFDFTLLSVEVARRRPSPRALAGGFFLASLFFLIVVLAQAFTTVYDYIPVIGPFFRDRFWLVFLLAGFGLVLPLPWVRGELPHAANHSLRRAFLPGVLAVLLGSVVWAVISHPRPVLPQAGSPLRVMTYNIQQGYSEDGVRSYDQQLRLIRTARPDILGLQESDPARFAGGNADVVRAFANSLDMYAYYGPKTPTGTFGIALLSRYPIENPRTFFLYSQGEQTAAILAQISVEGQPYTVLVTHLGNGGPMIQQQQVLGRLAGRERVIAMGDFNFDLASEQYALTDAQLDSAWTLAGSPYTPGLNVDHLIDHVFVSPGMQVNSAEYLVAPVSDHPALVVEIQP